MMFLGEYFTPRIYNILLGIRGGSSVSPQLLLVASPAPPPTRKCAGFKYYPDSRTAAKAATRLSVQIGVDVAGNILKEFSPELNRLLSRKHAEKKP
jgi:hypothetical protein